MNYAYRNDPNAAGETLNKLLPDDNIRRVVLNYFIETINVANNINPDRWSIALRREVDIIRLTVGQIEVLTMIKNIIRLILDNSTMPQRLETIKGVSMLKDNYENPVPHRYDRVKSSKGFKFDIKIAQKIFELKEVRESHNRLIELAAKHKLHVTAKKARSPGLIKYLEDYTKRKLSKEEDLFPGEIYFPDLYKEGSTRKIYVNAYERNYNARLKCIEIHGCSCVICGFNFAKKYKYVKEKSIIVHHLIPLSEIREGYYVNPEKDLRPVCPNCHLVIHSKKPPYTINEVKNMLKIQS